ncbi:hypothetical protein [Actinomycetospora termitidis]|uniref:Secreted protein n=1 Tax=Actinomycetospora termitidis TaxID=3053470 RepID=A0ABT7M2U7_9PSEU|nr:hypothetical protein [Actinomycetospora sp. Odt1-22]MDL5154985.1 hypothetical protein [Actinomycetospora sp. Odt1-22]
MIAKLGIAGVGVAAGLVALAPLASATESHGAPQPGGPSSTCSVAGGDAAAANRGDSEGLVGAVVQAPVGGLNAANIVCNSILNDNLSQNVVDVSVLGDGLDLLGLLGL